MAAALIRGTRARKRESEQGYEKAKTRKWRRLDDDDDDDDEGGFDVGEMGQHRES